MNNFYIVLGILFQVIAFSIAQRVAPGVPPQQYQPPPPQQQHQQYQQQPQHAPQYQTQQQHINAQVPVQQQQHHVPVQQQQHIPVQQQQQVPVQQVPVQQVPVQHQQAHGHHAPHQQQILHTGNLQQEREHIAGHLEVPIDTQKMTDQELQFHYFKMHDSDNNNMLDGCELIKSLIHWHEKPPASNSEGTSEEPPQEEHHEESESQSDESLIALIDPLLVMMDKNNDGFITYAEYKLFENNNDVNVEPNNGT